MSPRLLSREQKLAKRARRFMGAAVALVFSALLFFVIGSPIVYYLMSVAALICAGVATHAAVLLPRDEFI